jgi:transcriptional regulator with XRE-family HTH domain
MSMEAAARYLRTFREARGMSQEDVAEKIGVASKSVYNWESGQDTRGRKLAAWIRSVDAISDDVIELLDTDAATSEDGQRLAELRLSQQHTALADHVANGLGAEEAGRLARRLRRDPAFFEAFIRQFVDRDDG